jgi:hypothetical protein
VDAVAQALALQASVEAALAELAAKHPDGLTAAEETETLALRQAAGRLVQVAEQIAKDGLMVPGSMGQMRLHPLLGEERGLRKEISVQLRQLTFLSGQRALVERMNALTRDPALLSEGSPGLPWPTNDLDA